MLGGLLAGICLLTNTLPCWGADPAKVASLAQAVPGNARLFMEIREVEKLLTTPAGATTSALLANWMVQADALKQSDSDKQESSPQINFLNWRYELVQSIGLRNPQAAELLFNGPVGFAADSWSALGTAILLAEPIRPQELEVLLVDRRIPRVNKIRIRRYRLGNDHELACNGRFVIIGKNTGPSGLYARTLELWKGSDTDAMGGREDFQIQVKSLPHNCQLVAYANMAQPVASDNDNSKRPTAGWWPVLGSDWASAAVGVSATEKGISISTCRRVNPDYPVTFSAEPSIQSLDQLPDSAVLAWTKRIDYSAEYVRLTAKPIPEPFGFFLEVITTELSEWEIEQEFLSHLVGNSAFVVGQIACPIAEADVPGISVVAPTIGLMVKTNDSQAVERVLEKMANNVLQLCQLAAPKDQSVKVQHQIMDEQGTRINSIPLRVLFGPQAEHPLLTNMQFSWSFDGQMMIIASHADLIRQIIQARHGRTDCLKVDALQDRVGELREQDWHLETALSAQPKSLRNMVHSWIVYIRRYHPEMLQTDWWRWFHQQRSFSLDQLGIILKQPDESEAGLAISRILLNTPAEAYLQLGDRVLGVEEQRLEEHDGRETLDELIKNRRDREHLTLQILRDNKQRQVIIPLPTANLSAPHLEPMEFLRQFSSLLGTFSSAYYTSWRTSSDLVINRLELSTLTNPDDR